MSNSDMIVVPVRPAQAEKDTTATIHFVYYPQLGLFAIGPAVVKCVPAIDRVFEHYFGLSFANTVFSPDSQRTVTNGCIIHVWRNSLFGDRYYVKVENPLIHLFSLRRIQRFWIKRREFRRLAVVMALHKRLGKQSALGVLGMDLMKMVCFI